MIRLLPSGALNFPKIMWLVWACFIAKAMMYCAALPVWEGFDEYSHFACIQHIALKHSMPAPDAHISREVRASMRLMPVPWVIRDQDPDFTSYEAYWQLSERERGRRDQELRSLAPALGYDPGDGRFYTYEAQQAPLYYYAMAPVYWVIRDCDLGTRVWILRILTALLASLVIPSAYFAVRQVISQAWLAVGFTVAIACLPQLLLSACRISNEGLAIGAGGITAALLLRCLDSPPSVRQGVWLGLALGAALLTKAYFLAMLPPAAVVCVFGWICGSRRDAARQALAAAAVCGGIAGWWYVRTVLLTGSISGEQNDIAAHHSAMSLATAASRLNWWRAFDFLAISHIWLGNWSFLVVRSWMYRVVEGIAILGLAGAVLQFIRPRATLPRRDHLSLLALLWIVPVAGLCYHTLVGFSSIGAVSSMGYYLDAFIVPEMLLVITGLIRLLPERRAIWPGPVVAILGLALEGFGTWLLLLPYYAGLIVHNAAGGLPAFPITEYSVDVVKMLAARIVVNKSAWMSEWLVFGLFGVAVIASVILAGVSFWERDRIEDRD